MCKIPSIFLVTLFCCGWTILCLDYAIPNFKCLNDIAKKTTWPMQIFAWKEDLVSFLRRITAKSRNFNITARVPWIPVAFLRMCNANFSPVLQILPNPGTFTDEFQGHPSKIPIY